MSAYVRWRDQLVVLEYPFDSSERVMDHFSNLMSAGRVVQFRIGDESIIRLAVNFGLLADLFVSEVPPEVVDDRPNPPILTAFLTEDDDE